MRKEYVLISLIFLFSLLLRIVPPLILGNPTNIDVYQHSQTSVNFAADGRIVQHVLYNYPLGYHTLVMAFIMVTGIDVLWAQILLSSLLGALTVFPIFFLLKHISKNNIIALSGALFFGLAPGVIIFSAGTGMPQISAIFLGFVAFYLIVKHVPVRSPVFISTVLKNGFLWSIFLVIAGMTLVHTATTIFFSFMFVVMTFLIIFQNSKNKLWVPVFFIIFFILFMYFEFTIIALGFLTLLIIFLCGKIEKKYFFIIFACTGLILAFAVYFPMHDYYKERYYSIKYQAESPIKKILSYFSAATAITVPIATTTTIPVAPSSTTATMEELPTTSTIQQTTTTVSNVIALTKDQLKDSKLFSLPTMMNLAYYPFIIGISAFILMFFGLYYVIKTKNLFVIAVFIWVIAVFVAVWRNRFDLREISFLCIPIPLVAAFGAYYVERISSNFWKRIVIAVLIIMIIIPALAASVYAATNGPDRVYADAIHWLKDNHPDVNLSVVFPQNSEFISFVLKKPVIHGYDIFIEPDLENKISMIKSNNVTHLLISDKDKLRFAKTFMTPIQRYMNLVGFYTPEKEVIVPGIELIENETDIFEKVYDMGDVVIYRFVHIKIKFITLSYA